MSGFARKHGLGYWVAPEALRFITHVPEYDDVPMKGTPYPTPVDEDPDTDDDEY